MLVLTCLIASGCLEPKASEADLQTLIDLHRAGLQSVQSLECRIEWRATRSVEGSSNPAAERSKLFDVRRLGTRVWERRLAPGSDGEVEQTDRSSDGAEYRIRQHDVSAAADPDAGKRWAVPVAAARSPDAEFRAASLLLERLDVPDRNESSMFLARLAEWAESVRLGPGEVGDPNGPAGTVPIELVLPPNESTPDGSRMVVWINPQRDYRVAGYFDVAPRHGSPGTYNAVRTETRVESFQQVSGVWLPEQVTKESRVTSPKGVVILTRSEWTISNVRINGAIDSGELTVSFEPGSFVYGGPGKVYLWGDDGKPLKTLSPEEEEEYAIRQQASRRVAARRRPLWQWALMGIAVLGTVWSAIRWCRRRGAA